MCVAAVSEVIIEALNIYAARTGDYTPFERLPMRSWNNGSRTDIRPYIFQYDEVDSHGTADALSKFGIGREVRFEELLPGDFITMNRTTRSGHTAVFLGYVNKTYGDEPEYSNRVVGFRYFSAQGKGKPDAGLAYRWAFFSPNCPGRVPGKTRDCNIIFSHNQRTLNTGYMLHPRGWNIDLALKQIYTNYLVKRFNEIVGRKMSKKERARLGSTTSVAKFIAALLDPEMRVELKFSIPPRYDGIEGD